MADIRSQFLSQVDGSFRRQLWWPAVARDLKPDVIVCGVTIPYLGGNEACRSPSRNTSEVGG